MDIPEVLFICASFLDCGTLASCSRVSKQWHQTLIPVLYQCIHDQNSPSTEALTHYAQHIRYLSRTINNLEQKQEQEQQQQQHSKSLSVFSFRPVQCCNLKGLTLTFKNCQEDTEPWQAAILVGLNPGLLKLKITDDGRLVRPSWGQLFAQCGRHLQELVLSSVRLGPTETEQLLTLGPSLVKLELENSHITWSSTFTATPQFPQLSQLIVRNGSDSTRAFDWIRQCPKIELLYWDGFKSAAILNKTTCQTLRTHRQWASLQDITLLSPRYPMSDSHVAAVLDSCGPLRAVNVGCSRFYYTALSSMERHFGTLETLGLKYCRWIPSWMCRYIFESCSNLKSFYGGVIDAHDLVVGRGAESSRERQFKEDSKADEKHLEKITASKDGVKEENEDLEELKSIMARYATAREPVGEIRPWVCLDLVHLETNVRIQGAGRGWDGHVFERISKLQKLEYLDIWFDSDAYGGTTTAASTAGRKIRSLCLDLPSGLDRLTPLQELEVLLFKKSSNQGMEEEDVQWILDHFPRLAKISSNFNMDEETSAKLKQMVVDSQKAITVV
ncbi:hypothetical protein BGZ83_005645 [Gryganskiella cystojenkinii]|nr:hypothetical protein BGZ83_005645 [Gryganskiella cystojenkinii]